MRTDSAAWAVGFAGCLVDWLITRNWRRISLGLLPVLGAAILGGLVLWGSSLDRDRLAERYLKLADAEVAQWENAWAPVPNEDTPSPGAASTESAGDPTQPASDAIAAASAKGGSTEESTIPRFAEVLFRRVQQLQSGDQRSVFFVAMILAQRGSMPQALSLLSRIAPEDREGYAPAHAWLADYYLRQPITAENLNSVKHHSRAALRWPRTPPTVLANVSQLFWKTGEPDVAVQALTLAAERDPKFHLQLAGLASQQEKWKLLREQSLTKAESHLQTLVNEKPQDVEARLQFISALLLKKDFAAAERAVMEGRTLADDDRLRRAQSEIYRLQFVSTTSFSDSTWSGQVELLNKAFHVDPTNLKVFEEVAQLARISGEAPNAELEAELNKLLAEGRATSITHLWIAERYLVTDQMEKAVPHLEQALERNPNAVHCLNNLAYCLAKLYPDRSEEALSYIDRAISIYSNHPAYHDTRGTVLVRLGRHKEAIASLERAVELLRQTGQPPKASYHQRLASAYEAIGQKDLAKEHDRIATRLLQRDAQSSSMQNVASATGSAETPEGASTASIEAPSDSSSPRE